MVRRSFADWSNEEEADLVVRLIKETRSMSTYIPELELIMVNDEDEVIGYALFSGFHLGGKYMDELLLLSPVAVRMSFCCLVLLPSKSNGSGSIFQKKSLNMVLKKQSKWDSAR